MVEETERLPSARPLVAVLLLLLAGAPAVLHAQSSPWISIELSPGRNVPRNTEVTATITLSNLDVDSYTSVVFRADLTVYNRGEQRCDGDDTGKDMEKAVDQSREVFTVRVYDACPHDTYGHYTLDTRIFQADASASGGKIELASASTRFSMSRYLTSGEVTAPPPAPGEACCAAGARPCSAAPGTDEAVGSSVVPSQRVLER